MTAVNQSKPVVGLVGGIGSGKSTIAAQCKQLGAAVIDGDVVGHEVLRRPEVRDALVQRWGTEILAPDGQVNRGKLGWIVFADPTALKELETLVHPLIKSELRRRIDAARQDPGVAFVVLDAAVLLEAGWDDVCDVLVFVDAPDAQRQRRVRQSRGWPKEAWQARENLQLALKIKKARADYGLDNSGTPDESFRQIRRIVSELVASLPC